MNDRILRFHEVSRLTLELARLAQLSHGSRWQFRNLYLERTKRSLPRELVLLREAKCGPRFIVRLSHNRKLTCYYNIAEVLAFFGGPSAIFHHRDRPELFSEHRAAVLPSLRATP